MTDVLTKRINQCSLASFQVSANPSSERDCQLENKFKSSANVDAEKKLILLEYIQNEWRMLILQCMNILLLV